MNSEAVKPYTEPPSPLKVELSFQIVKKYISPLASDMEIYTFMQLCRAQNLNPFLREAYLIKYAADQPAAMVVGKETFMKRASRNEHYRGFKSGIIVNCNTKEGPVIRYKEGAAVFPGEILLGGWCDVTRDDRESLIHIEVSLTEYEGKKKDGTVTKMWDGKQATMIRKVAVVQAHREAFPDETEGMLALEEIRTIDITELPEYGLDKPQAGHIGEPGRRGDQKGTNGQEVPSDAKEKLKAELTTYCQKEDGTRDEPYEGVVLKQCSLFTGNDGKERWIGLDQIDKAKDSWVGTTLGKIRKLAEGNAGA
jgi:phage recombination protein Bet